MSDEKSVEIISLLKVLIKSFRFLINLCKINSEKDISEEIKLFLDNCFGESSSSMFNKLTDLNNQVCLLSKEIHSTKAYLKMLKNSIRQ